MRHKKSGRQFGRDTSSRRAMLRNLAANLIAHERIETTEAKAKELRRVAEKLITKATRLGKVAHTPQDQPDAQEDRERRLEQHAAGSRVDVGERRALSEQEDGDGEERNEHCRGLGISLGGDSAESGRDGGIRTHDPLTPSQVRYQAALHPEF